MDDLVLCLARYPIELSEIIVSVNILFPISLGLIGLRIGYLWLTSMQLAATMFITPIAPIKEVDPHGS